MKRFTLLLVCMALMQLVFSLGVFVGLCVRSDPSRPVVVSDPLDPPCTCVPCLPDLFCKKCGHKSRDCPKLKGYFSRLSSVVTNRFFISATNRYEHN